MHLNNTRDITINIESENINFNIRGNNLEELIADLDSSDIDTSLDVINVNFNIGFEDSEFGSKVHINSSLELRQETNIIDVMNYFFSYIRLGN